MPRKRCHKVNKDKISLMKNIKSRLIQISIKIENYIYKQKPISGAQAKSFLDEISSYETQCDGNAECLQVIQKLTKYMKIVISNEDAVKDTINDNISTSLEPKTMVNNKSHDTPYFQSTVCKVAKENGEIQYLINNDNKQCEKFTNINKENAENFTSCNNYGINTSAQAEGTKDTLMNTVEATEVDLRPVTETNTNENLIISSTGALDLRKTVNHNSCATRNSEINFIKTIDPNTVPKLVKKVHEKTIVTAISQNCNMLDLKKDANFQIKANIETKTCVDVHDVKYKYANNSKSNFITTKDQPLKLINKVPNMQSNPPNYCNSIEKSVNKGIEVNRSDGPQKEMVQKKKIKLKNFHSQDLSKNEIIVLNEESGEKNVAKKRQINKIEKYRENKNKTKKESELNTKGKKVKRTEKEKKVKMAVNKTKDKKNGNIDNAKNKQLLKKGSVIALDLSWFDTIEFIREVDEEEYFTFSSDFEEKSKNSLKVV